MMDKLEFKNHGDYIEITDGFIRAVVPIETFTDEMKNNVFEFQALAGKGDGSDITEQVIIGYSVDKAIRFFYMKEKIEATIKKEPRVDFKGLADLLKGTNDN